MWTHVNDTASSPRTIYHILHINWSFMINQALWDHASFVFVYMYVCHAHTVSCVCSETWCVLAFDLLTHVFNWNSMQSAYCSTNRICTWWCQPKFFRHLLSVLRSHTVRQDHLARLPETPVETRNTTVISPVCFRCICCHRCNSNHYIPLCWIELQRSLD